MPEDRRPKGEILLFCNLPQKNRGNLKKNTIFAFVRTIKQLGIMLVNGILAFFNLGTGEVILIVAIILLLFGGRKIPELMRGLGKGVKSFKQGMNEVEDELKKPIEDLDKDKN